MERERDRQTEWGERKKVIQRKDNMKKKKRVSERAMKT